MANAALLAARAPAIAPADAAALIDPPPFLLWNFPRPPRGAEVFPRCFLPFFPLPPPAGGFWPPSVTGPAPSTPPTISTTWSPPFMAVSVLAEDMTLTGRLEKTRGEGDVEMFSFFESGSLELFERPFLFLPLHLFPCSCSFSACFARTGGRLESKTLADYCSLSCT